MLLYIHGFNSSSTSFKARLLCQEMAHLGRGREFAAPDLPHQPAQAIQQLRRLIEAVQPNAPVKLVGSSLGGYYATFLAEQYGLKAVLINPAVRPHQLLQAMLGPQQNLYTGEHYVLTQQHLDEWEELEVEALTRLERYLLLVQTGDEVLDYRRAVEKYAGAQQIIIPGGDHGFQGFEAYIAPILAF